MSLLQRTGVYKKTDHWHPALISSGAMTSGVGEVTKADGDILIPNAQEAPRWVSDDVLKRAPPPWEVFTEYAATSFVVAIICVWLALALANVICPADWTLIDP